MALQPDGKLVVVGEVSPTGIYPTAYNTVLARYNADGTLDNTFGSGGIVIQNFAGGNAADAVVVEPDGTIDVAGYVQGTNSTAGFASVARFLPNGALETQIPSTTGGDYVGALLQPGTGRLVTVGNTVFTIAPSFVNAYSATAPLSGSDSLQVVDVTPPVAANPSIAMNEDAAVPVTLSATDADGDALTYSVVTSPAHRTLSGTAPNLTYTPAAGYYGTDTFTYTANDGNSNGNTATVTITVNAPPAASGVSVTTNENGAVVVTLSGFLWLLSDGAFLYIPKKGYSGTDTFTYQASDGQATSNVATVTLTIVSHGNDHGDGGDGGDRGDGDDGGDHRDGTEFSGAFAGVPVVNPDGLVFDQLAGTGGKKKS